MANTVNVNITINGISTQANGTSGISRINTQGSRQDHNSGKAAQKPERQPIDRTNERLIDNGTTFDGLIDILKRSSEAVAAEKNEIEEKKREAKEAERRRIYGEDYDLIFGDDNESDSSDSSDDPDEYNATELSKEKRRPGAVQLRKFEPRVAMMNIGSDGTCEVYANGYAVYDNGDRKTVLWVPDCGSATYYFTPLRDEEKTYLKQKDDVGEDVFGTLPWYMALTVAGEDSIERNLIHPKSKGSSSDSDDPADWEGLPDWRCVGGTKFPNPEEYVLKKEAAMERKMCMSEKQREAYELYCEQGWKEKDIAEELGISRAAVTYRITGAMEKIKKYGIEA